MVTTDLGGDVHVEGSWGYISGNHGCCTLNLSLRTKLGYLGDNDPVS